ELGAVDVVGGDDALEGGFDDRLGRRRDHPEQEAAPVDAMVEELDQALDVVLEMHPLARLDQMLAAHAPELRIVAKQVRELGALLDEVDAGESRDLLPEARGTDQLAQNDSRVVEAQGLVEIASHEIRPCRAHEHVSTSPI